MRLGLLGPAGGDVPALGRAAEFLINSARVQRAIYLGADDTLDRAVATWARKLVGDDPSDDAAWRRAADVAITGTPEQIDKLVQLERARQRLKALESLPEQVSRTIEMIGDRVAVLIHDKALLDEEDILAANLLFYGKSDTPLIKRIGARWFVTPGVIGCEGGGIAVVDDDGEDITVTIHDSLGKAKQTEALTMQRTAKMRVQGDV
jgi:hypothetical protein